ncbi:hypothetical protein D4R99_05550 [bacterium]|nr:MAG: hypothetical protein D4R99_05550 [bacterium]
MNQPDLDKNNQNRLSGKVGKKLKSVTGWPIGSNGDNSISFGALPGGFLANNYHFYKAQTDACFWSSSEEYGVTNAYSRNLTVDNDGVNRFVNWKVQGNSVRCLKN